MLPLHLTLIVAGLVWAAFVLRTELRRDWKSPETVNHSKGLLRRLEKLSPSIILMCIAMPTINWWYYLAPFAVIGSNWIFYFDLFWNLHYNRPPFFIPTPHLNSAVTDKILYKIPYVLRPVIKLVMIVVSMYYYIKPFTE